MVSDISLSGLPSTCKSMKYEYAYLYVSTHAHVCKHILLSGLPSTCKSMKYEYAYLYVSTHAHVCKHILLSGLPCTCKSMRYEYAYLYVGVHAHLCTKYFTSGLPFTCTGMSMRICMRTCKHVSFRDLWPACTGICTCMYALCVCTCMQAYVIDGHVSTSMGMGLCICLYTSICVPKHSSIQALPNSMYDIYTSDVAVWAYIYMCVCVCVCVHMYVKYMPHAHT